MRERRAFDDASIGQIEFDRSRRRWRRRGGRSRAGPRARAKRAKKLSQLSEVGAGDAWRAGHSTSRQAVMDQRGQLRIVASGQPVHHARRVLAAVAVAAMADAAAIFKLRPAGRRRLRVQYVMAKYVVSAFRRTQPASRRTAKHVAETQHDNGGVNEFHGLDRYSGIAWSLTYAGEKSTPMPGTSGTHISARLSFQPPGKIS